MRMCLDNCFSTYALILACSKYHSDISRCQSAKLHATQSSSGSPDCHQISSQFVNSSLMYPCTSWTHHSSSIWLSDNLMISFSIAPQMTGPGSPIPTPTSQMIWSSIGMAGI